ncbi:hypothetical protein LZK73_20565 [Neorhizobium galegae]|nr:hypothetical protein LZK73_20565 [Neorhizobium galegae]
MVPRQFHVWPESMPRTSSGKLARPDVVRLCREWMQGGEIVLSEPPPAAQIKVTETRENLQ